MKLIKEKNLSTRIWHVYNLSHQQQMDNCDYFDFDNIGYVGSYNP